MHLSNQCRLRNRFSRNLIPCLSRVLMDVEVGGSPSESNCHPAPLRSKLSISRHGCKNARLISLASASTFPSGCLMVQELVTRQRESCWVSLVAPACLLPRVERLCQLQLMPPATNYVVRQNTVTHYAFEIIGMNKVEEGVQTLCANDL